MSRRSIRRAALGALLVATLAAAAPVQASPWNGKSSTSNVFAQVWEWIQGLWSGPVAASCAENCDRGFGVDPDG